MPSVLLAGQWYELPPTMVIHGWPCVWCTIIDSLIERGEIDAAHDLDEEAGTGHLAHVERLRSAK